MDDPNRSRRDGPLRFRLRERDRYLKEFALEIRTKSRFAEQMIKGVHQAPARAVDDDDEDVQEDQFVQRRLENSTRGSLEMSSDDGTPSSGAEELSQEEQLELERAIQAAVRLAVKTTAQHETKETGAATAPAAAAEGVLDIERAAADATAGGLGSDARPTSGGGMEGQATPPVFNRSMSSATTDAHRDGPVPPAQPTSPAKGGAEAASGVISFSITPTKGDMPHAGGPADRRETMTSRMSTLMKGLRSINLTGVQAQEAGAAPAPPTQPKGAEGPLLYPESKEAPSHGGYLSDQDNPVRVAASILQHQIRDWYQRLQQHRKPHRSRHGRSRVRSSRRTRRRHTGEAYLKRMKLVSALSKRGMSPEDYRSMDMDMQRELWEHCNELIYQMLGARLRALPRLRRLRLSSIDPAEPDAKLMDVLAAELDAKRAIRQGTELAASL